MVTKMRTLGQLLREWREREGFTSQAQAAVHLGVSPRAYQDWENDKKLPDTKILTEKIAPALGLDLGFAILDSKGRWLNLGGSTVAA